MKVKSKIVARYEDKGRLKAIATICLDGKFLVTGVRVADCQKGLAVFMPSREIHDGEYRDICFPITSELYKQIKDSVLEAYARPEDDDPAYGEGFGVEGKVGQTERDPSAAGRESHGTASGKGEQTGEALQPDTVTTPDVEALPDAVAMLETGILLDNARLTGNLEGDKLLGKIVQPEDMAQCGQ